MYKTRHDITQLREQAEMLNEYIEYFKKEAEATTSEQDAAFNRRMLAQLEHEQDLMFQLADSWHARETGSQMAFAIFDCFSTIPPTNQFEVTDQALELLKSRFLTKNDWKH